MWRLSILRCRQFKRGKIRWGIFKLLLTTRSADKFKISSWVCILEFGKFRQMIQGYRSDMCKIWFVVLAEIYQKIREPLNFEDSLENSFEWVWTMTLRIHDYSSDYLFNSIISIASTICCQISSLVGRLMIILIAICLYSVRLTLCGKYQY